MRKLLFLASFLVHLRRNFSYSTSLVGSLSPVGVRDTKGDREGRARRERRADSGQKKTLPWLFCHQPSFPLLVHVAGRRRRTGK